MRAVLRRCQAAGAAGLAADFGGAALALTVVLLFLFPWAAVVPALAAVFVAAFFRDPPRSIPTEPGAVEGRPAAPFLCEKSVFKSAPSPLRAP